MSRQFVVVLAVSIAFAAALVPPYVSEQLGRDIDVVLKAPILAGNTCDANTLNQCSQAFFNNFGFNGNKPYNETDFDNAFFNYLNVQGVDGWASIRTWMGALQSCMGGQPSFEACFNWNFLMSTWNIDQLNAKLYNSRFVSLAYDVGPAYQVLYQNWYCILGVAEHEGPQIAQCQQRYQDEQNQNPNMTCQHIAEYLVCIERPYLQHCGRAAAGVVCRGEQISYAIFSPDCSSQAALHCRGAPGKEMFYKKRNN